MMNTLIGIRSWAQVVELLRVHLHRAVAGHAAHQPVGQADRRAHRGGQAEAHRAEAARVDPAPRRWEVGELRYRHLALADPRRWSRSRSPPVASYSAWTMYCGLISLSVVSS